MVLEPPRGDDRNENAARRGERRFDRRRRGRTVGKHGRFRRRPDRVHRVINYLGKPALAAYNS